MLQGYPSRLGRSPSWWDAARPSDGGIVSLAFNEGCLAALAHAVVIEGYRSVQPIGPDEGVYVARDLVRNSVERVVRDEKCHQGRLGAASLRVSSAVA